MLIEVPDLDTILGLVAAFVAGLIVIIVYYKARSYTNLGSRGGSAQRDPHLDEYERQLVEMKIRMDALEVGGPQKSVIPTSHLADGAQIGGGAGQVLDSKMLKSTPKMNEMGEGSVPGTPNITHHNATEWVLHQVADSAKTSRDIQRVLGKSREHTARLLKKLYDGGLVDRNVKTKPYTYSITKAGQKHLENPGG